MLKILKPELLNEIKIALTISSMNKMSSSFKEPTVKNFSLSPYQLLTQRQTNFFFLLYNSNLRHVILISLLFS